MDSFNFFKKIWHYHHLFLRPPKSFLGPGQDVSPNITQSRTNRKFLHKYGYNVKNANCHWTALIFEKNLALPQPIFKTPKMFPRPLPRCLPNITQTRTNHKFLHKYGYNVKNANGYWTAVFSQKNLALSPPIFKTPKKFSRSMPRCLTKYYATQNQSQISP